MKQRKTGGPDRGGLAVVLFNHKQSERRPGSGVFCVAWIGKNRTRVCGIPEEHRL